MKQKWKQISSLLMSVCMVLTMLPTVAFAEEGTPSSTSKITAFTDLAEDVVLQEVEFGTTLDELTLPSSLTATVTTGSVITTTVSGWSSNPAYDGDTEGGYIFTPTLNLPNDTTLADGVTLPQITVTVKVADTPMLLGAGMQLLGTGTGADITGDFTDVNFLAAVRAALGKVADAKIYDNDNFASVTSLSISDLEITSLAGIQYFTELIFLYCEGNKLSELDVSKNTKLSTLNCSGNKLSELDVSKNPELNNLYCFGNKLSELDVSNNTKLALLYCYDNQLSDLNVSNITMLMELNCSENYMPDDSVITGLATSSPPIFTFAPQKSRTDITANFNDANFLVAVRTALGKVANAKIYDKDDFASVMSLSINNSNITSLAGIQYFTKLTRLECAGNQLSALDVRNNTALTSLNCADNQLSALDVSQNTALTSLDCYDNQLSALDVSNNTELWNLFCYGNQLSALDVRNNTALIMLHCYDNQLGALDVSKNTALSELDCSYNYMLGESAVTGLDKNLPNIFTFSPQNSRTDITANFTDANFLAEVRKALRKAADAPIYDKDDFASIKTLNVNEKKIKSLKGIAYFTELTDLYCDNNQLTELDVSKNTELTWLSCTSNQLSALDVSQNTVLTELYCYNNQLTKLDVSKNTVLTELYCDSNQLTELDVSKNTVLTDLWCPYNQLIELDVSKNTVLTKLSCSYNYMLGESAVKGLNKNLTTTFTFDPQKSNTSIHAVTISSGTASPSTAVANAIVNITADAAPSGKRFKEWRVESGGITLANAKAASTSFTMPANAVKITANYEDIPAGVTPVTGVTLNKNNLSLYSNISPNTAVLTATVAPASATDRSVTWQSSNTAVATVDARGTIKATGNGTATITVTTTDGGYIASCTVTVSTYTSGGGSSAGGSSGGGSGGSSPSGGSATNAVTVTADQPNQPITAAVSVTATAGTNGTAGASIPDQAVTDAISKAQAEATKQETTEKGISIGLNVTMPQGATALTATLSQNALNSLVSAGVTNLEINGSPVTISFDQKALTEIQKQTSSNINITIAPKTNLSETAKAIIGSRPVYDITVSYGNRDTVSSFGEGVATIAIPYIPANGEVISGLYAVYIDEAGNATRVEGSAYDANSGSILFTTPHFSMYGVGYMTPSEKLTDISSHWAKESIAYVVDSGILPGLAETTFEPNTAMTREMLVTALGRLAEVDASGYATSSFTDVKAGSTSQPYIEWAYEAEIVKGIGNNEFAPDRAITRQEIAVIIANFTKATGYTLPVVSEATAYTDASNIGDYYKTAVTVMQQAGIMKGGTDNKFNPKSNATRAEVSSMLHRYIKLTI